MYVETANGDITFQLTNIFSKLNSHSVNMWSCGKPSQGQQWIRSIDWETLL